MRIYVGNLAFRSNAEDVRKAFAAFGEVSMVDLAMDRATGRSAGYAFVEMPNEEEAQAAITRLKEINSRVVSVHVATEVVEPEQRRGERPGGSTGSRPPRRSRDAGPDDRNSRDGGSRGRDSRGGDSRGRNSRGGDSQGGRSRWGNSDRS